MSRKRKIHPITVMRMIVSFGLLVTSVIVILTGIVLYLNTTQNLYRLVSWFPASAATNLHTYAGFVMAGLVVVHLYLNWNSIKSYIRIIKSAT